MPLTSDGAHVQDYLGHFLLTTTVVNLADTIRWSVAMKKQLNTGGTRNRLGVLSRLQDRFASTEAFVRVVESQQAANAVDTVRVARWVPGVIFDLVELFFNLLSEPVTTRVAFRLDLGMEGQRAVDNEWEAALQNAMIEATYLSHAQNVFEL